MRWPLCHASKLPSAKGLFKPQVSSHSIEPRADTPGLLAREDEERNNMEKLTLAVLHRLPSVPVLVIDVTEECGTSVSRRSPGCVTGIVYMASRSHMGAGGSRWHGTCASATRQAQWCPTLPDGAQIADQLLIRRELRERLPAKEWIDAVSKADLLTAAHRRVVAAEVPGAILVSSVTQQGVPELQAAVVEAIAREEARAAAALAQSSETDAGLAPTLP